MIDEIKENYTKFCECCGVGLTSTFPRTIYCSRCSVSHSEAMMKFNQYTAKYKKLEDKYYSIKAQFEKLQSIKKKEVKKN